MTSYHNYPTPGQAEKMPKLLDFKELCDFLKGHRADKCMITFHSVGDRDALGSAISLSMYMTNSVVSTPDYITNNAKYMAERVGHYNKVEQKFVDDASLIIIVDTNTLETTGRFKERIEASKAQLLFIDHHLLQQAEERFVMFNDESFNSTASIIYNALKSLDFPIDKSSAILLLNGIISDSAEFRNASSETFKQISELLNIAGMTYAEIMAYFHNPVAVSNRYYLIRDLYQSTVEIMGKYLVVYGITNSHANIAADFAIQTGADFAVFWDVNEREASISARLRPPLDLTLHIHLGKTLHEAATYINGNGGGHPAAAGAYGPNRDMVGEAVKYILDQMRKKFEGSQ